MTGMMLTLAGAGVRAGSVGSGFASLSPPTVHGVILGVGSCETDPMRVIPAGVGPYAYAWSIVGDPPEWTIEDADAVSTRFTCLLDLHGDVNIVEVQVVVTDTGAGDATCTLTGEARAHSTSTA